jgi:hypothetical protein
VRTAIFLSRERLHFPRRGNQYLVEINSVRL